MLIRHKIVTVFTPCSSMHLHMHTCIHATCSMYTHVSLFECCLRLPLPSFPGGSCGTAVLLPVLKILAGSTQKLWVHHSRRVSWCFVWYVSCPQPMAGTLPVYCASIYPVLCLGSKHICPIHCDDVIQPLHTLPCQPTRVC